MPDHRTDRRAPRTRFLSSVRLRALLSLGVALGIGATGTFAFWTDDVVISGSSFTAGRIDLKVNGADAYATTALSTGAMVPGNTVAEVLTVQNVQTAAAKYSLIGGLSGTDAAEYTAAGANGLLLTIRQGGTRSTSTATPTCTGGTALVTDLPLTNVTTTSILAKRPATALVATTGTEVLCFQVKLSDTAPTGLQGKTVTAQFTVKGTSDIS